MGSTCCGLCDDQPSPSVEQQSLIRKSPQSINPIEDRDRAEREITIHNQSNKALWVKIHNSNDENPGENKVIIWSTFNHKGTRDTRITAWYYDRLIDFGDDDMQNAKKKPVSDRWSISPNDDIFVFDGKYLFPNKGYSSDNDVFNTRKIPPSDKGEYFVIPAIFDKNKSLMVMMDDTEKNIVIQRIRHTPFEIFKLQEIGNMGYYNIISKQTDLIFTMNEKKEASTLCLVEGKHEGEREEKDEKEEKDKKVDEKKKYNAQFKIEPIRGSDNTFQIRSRWNRDVLRVDRDGNITTLPENIDDPGQRFFFQPAGSEHTD